MAKLAAVILADGFEPLEVVAPTDVLRRGGVEVALVSIMGGAEVISAHNIAFHADMLLEEINLDDCAGPMVLADCRLLIGRKATCYPGCEDVLPEGTYVADRGVVVDDNLITANGPASALPFGLALLEALCGKAESETVAKSMLYK